MRIFKGFLVVFYAFIVLGSVQTYSAKYNGQEVFSLVGVIDNFLITASLPLIVYWVVWLIRKFVFKKE